MSGLEKHYTAAEVAELWAISEDTVRNLFRDTHGVLKITRPARRGKRSYLSIRIPESVLLKRHNELHGKVA
jgi:MarR-like DNA-binding transcriptional regulator SgrR of sgrS sRNA